LGKQSIESLREHFGIDDMLVFSENENGEIKAGINTATASAEIYMQGAHLTRWQPKDQKPVLFLSDRSSFEAGKAIRGGIPLIFPWFGPYQGATNSDIKFPSHGFARTSNDWLLVAAGRSKDDFLMTFELTDSDQSRGYGFDHFKLTYKVGIGEELELELIFENNSNKTVQIEEAFHTYFAISDVEKVSLTGLANTEYLDKTDEFKRKRQSEKELMLTGETDRPYLNSETQIEVKDRNWNRSIFIDKLNSQSTVIWNPWKDQTAKLADMQPDAWKQMVCVETANVDQNAISVAPGTHHAMHARVRVRPR
jgi:glucose-6-phosphate 1-epimerase